MSKASKKFNFINIVTQNAHGIKSTNRIHELTTQINSKKLFAVCLQETWRNGDAVMNKNWCRFLLHELSSEIDTSRRGKEGVGIILSKGAT